MSTPAIKARLARAKAALRREDGAIDLPSTMTSVLVITAFLAVAAVVVFGVIPWAQNNAAKQLVSQVATAQSTYYAMSGDGSMSSASSPTDPQYGSVHDLVTEDLLAGFTGAGANPTVTTAQTTEDTKTKLKIITTNSTATSGTSTTDTFVVRVRSDTGAMFTASNANPQPVPFTGTW
ncbi:hypothetical protein LG293_16180 (plasmid) [Citricoccus nitrophenolicus]